MRENNTRIAYKDQMIWTSKGCCDLLLLLLIEESNTAGYNDDRRLHTALVNRLHAYCEADLNSILTESSIITQMEKMLLHILARIQQADKKYCYDWRQQLFSSYLATDPSIDKKTAGRLLSELPDMTAPAISGLLHQVHRLIKDIYIFETVPTVTLEELTGHWQAAAEKSMPQYDINFNMLDDISPATAPILLSIQPTADTFHLEIDIPVSNWTTREKGSLQWIAGIATMAQGCISVKEAGRAVYKIPVIAHGTDYFDTFLFRTDLRFKRTQAEKYLTNN